MSGVKGRSGRKKTPRNVMRFLHDAIESNAYELVQALVDKAKGGDKESLFYCFDRIGGKPRQDTGLEISGGEQLTAGLVTQLFTILAAKRREMIQIEGGNDGYREEERADTGEGEALQG